MRISIITQTYNQKETLLKLFESIEPQKDLLHEQIIYDDGSTDGTVELIHEWESRLPITFIEAPHEGMKLAKHFNKCIDLATGDIAFQVFGDTYIASNALEEIHLKYVKDSVGCGYEYQVKDGEVVENDYRYPPNDEMIELTGKPKCFYAIPGNSMIASLPMLKEIKADERYEGYGVDDTDQVLRLFMNGARIIAYNSVKVYHPQEKSAPDSRVNTLLLKSKIEGHGHMCNADVFSLDFDDFSLENNNFEYLRTLKDHLPNLKVSMFMIPFDYQYYGRIMDFQREEIIQVIKDNKDWIELIPHGLTHKPREFEFAKYEAMDDVLSAIDAVFKSYDLPYVKGFKAPYWLYTEDMVKYFDEKGWWMASDRNQPNAPRTKKHFEYTHSIDEPFWLSQQKIVKLHGHISEPSSNNLYDNMHNLLKINPKAEFKFASELLCES